MPSAEDDGEEVIGSKRLHEDSHFDPSNGQSALEYMSQLLETKRRKMTQTQQDSNESEDDNSDEDSSEGSESESEDSDEENDEVQDSSPSTAGVIERLVLKNFMCHESFELNLSPQLNFIIGRNGSGKSAILTGISVGLGAKASDTSRGSSIKSLIKDGKSTARAIITLANRGEDAFQPDTFGSKIIIERKIQRQGANSYAIKSESGKTVSTKKQLLDEILHKFNITVDNPMAFLSQDKAREFLTTTTDKSKFEYFMSGSSIKDITNKFGLISTDIQRLKEKIKLTQTHFDVAVKKYDESAAMYEQFKRSDNLRRQLQLMHGKIYWFNVTSVEKKMESYRERIEQLNFEVSELETNVESTNLDLSSRATQRLDLDRKLRESNQLVEELSTELEKQSDNLGKVKNQLQSMSEDIKAGEQEIHDINKEIKDKEHMITKEQDRLDQQQGGSEEILAEKLEKYNEIIHEKRRKLDKSKERLEYLSGRDYKHDSEKLSELQQKIQDSREEVQALEGEKRALANSQRDRYSQWGRETNSVLAEIRKVSDWHKVPLGPLGSFVSLKNEYSKWSYLVNTMYGKTLDSYLVCDEHDRKLLTNIFRKMRVNKTVVVRSFERFDYLKGKSDDYLTILDVLQFENTDVCYTLIDINNVEKDVLCDDSDLAQEARKHPKVGNAFHHRDNISAERYSGGNGSLRLDPIMYNKNLNKLSRGRQVTAQDISDMDRKLTHAQSKASEIERNYHDLKKSLDQTKRQEMNQLNKEINELNLQIKELNNKIFKINNRLNDDGDRGKIEALKQEIEECKEQIEHRERTINAVHAEREHIISSREQDKVNFIDLKKKHKAALSEKNENEKALADFDIQSTQLTSDLAHFEKGIDKRKRGVEDTNEKLEKFEQKIQEILPLAEEKCAREEVPIAPEDTSHSITEEYKNIQQTIAEAEKHVGKSYQEVQNELLQSKELKDNLEETLNSLIRTERILDDDLANRFNYTQTTINKCVNEAMASFEESLALRGFTGELKFMYSTQELKMLVKTPNDNLMRTVESLSGGEKSFTQIALLLAIWRVMDSKIRGLDEFDVFMDSVNRTISIRLLLNELRMYPKSQSIFITPQDITSVADLDRSDVKIHQMHAPRDD